VSDSHLFFDAIGDTLRLRERAVLLAAGSPFVEILDSDMSTRKSCTLASVGASALLSLPEA